MPCTFKLLSCAVTRTLHIMRILHKKSRALFFHDMLDKMVRGNLPCNYCSYTQMSRGSGWIKVEFQWYSALIPQPPMLSPWVSLSQINLSWLLYWQTQRRIWQGKPVTCTPRVKPPFLAVFRSFLTATAVDCDIFRNLRQEERKLLYTDAGYTEQWKHKNRKIKCACQSDADRKKKKKIDALWLNSVGFFILLNLLLIA